MGVSIGSRSNKLDDKISAKKEEVDKKKKVVHIVRLTGRAQLNVAGAYLKDGLQMSLTIFEIFRISFSGTSLQKNRSFMQSFDKV
ncbi:hypothetical protein SUGI_0331650 [Cryptomeria japonica]|nr:hypothetical protein SUGI_0331650 [Cryptomeria japonica]